MSSRWYVLQGDKTFGPFTTEKLRQGIKRGKITPDTLIAPEGSDTSESWRTASKEPLLFGDSSKSTGPSAPLSEPVSSLELPTDPPSLAATGFEAESLLPTLSDEKRRSDESVWEGGSLDVRNQVLIGRLLEYLRNRIPEHWSKSAYAWASTACVYGLTFWICTHVLLAVLSIARDASLHAVTPKGIVLVEGYNAFSPSNFFFILVALALLAAAGLTAQFACDIFFRATQKPLFETKQKTSSLALCDFATFPLLLLSVAAIATAVYAYYQEFKSEGLVFGDYTVPHRLLGLACGCFAAFVAAAQPKAVGIEVTAEAKDSEEALSYVAFFVKLAAITAPFVVATVVAFSSLENLVRTVSLIVPLEKGFDWEDGRHFDIDAEERVAFRQSALESAAMRMEWETALYLCDLYPGTFGKALDERMEEEPEDERDLLDRAIQGSIYVCGLEFSWDRDRLIEYEKTESKSLLQEQITEFVSDNATSVTRRFVQLGGEMTPSMPAQIKQAISDACVGFVQTKPLLDATDVRATSGWLRYIMSGLDRPSLGSFLLFTVVISFFAAVVYLWLIGTYVTIDVVTAIVSIPGLLMRPGASADPQSRE